jgi:hypothetical protein
MKTNQHPRPHQSASFKKALGNSRPFDEADYYKSKKVEMGGEEDFLDLDDEEEMEYDDDDDDDDE